ncbi:glycoside hydrolase family 35 protein [Ceratobasidium sp. AG-Ba]|nr:glycoside hydrolase family 35 protein [Ceratobasidium sp. AG-Ba]
MPPPREQAPIKPNHVLGPEHAITDDDAAGPIPRLGTCPDSSWVRASSTCQWDKLCVFGLCTPAGQTPEPFEHTGQHYRNSREYWLTGVAGSAGIISAMNAGVKSFPEKLHASVTSTTNSAFGLSAFFFSSLARELFPGRTMSFLMVLVFGTAIPVLVGALVIKAPPIMVGRIRLPADDNEARVPGDEDLQARAGGEDPEAVQDELRDVLRDGVRVPAEEVPLRSGDESVLYGERNPWASQAQTPAGQTPKSSLGGSGEEDIHGLGLFKVVDFWIIFGIVGLLAGPGLMYINNVGSIVQALYAKNVDGEWNEGAVQAVQASQVGLLSVSSFVGRLGVGFIADYINHSHTVPRTSCLIVSSIFGIVAESMLARVETTAGLSAVSGVLGISYGTTFALFPALVLERFGLAHFAQNAGLMGIAAALFGNVFNYGFGRNFDAHSGGSPAGGATNAGNMQCYNGKGCYVDAQLKSGTYVLALVFTSGPLYMRLSHVLLGAALGVPAIAQSNADQSQNPRYVPSPGSPGFYAGHSSAAVTFDQHSLMLDGKRIMVFSGEFHPWRLPSIPLWRDVLEKMKAGGFNAVSIYLHWGIAEGKQGKLNFEGHRSVTTFLDVAKSVGILVIVRPGPYINAETSGGGFPGWVTNFADKARSNGTEFTAAWKPYIAEVSKFVAPYQYPDGPVILVQSENEFNMSNRSDPITYGHTDHMKWIEETMRANGITKVPLTHNDPHAFGQFASGAAKVDLYAWDGYPLGFDCSHPSVWNEVDSGIDADHQKFNPAEPVYLAEFQGGSYDPWDGPGYGACYDLINEQFANVFYKNNYAAGTYLQSLYMTYGGTNWGNLATPTVYTSYDYGAAISEDRSLTPKFAEIKLQSYLLHASPNYHLAGRIGLGTSYSSNSAVFTTNLATPSGQNFYIVRQTTNANTARVEFTLKVNTTAGVLTVPQYGGPMSLDGRESKIVVTEYPFGASILRYSTAEVATWATFDGADHIVLYAKNQTIEAVVPTNATSAASSTSSVSVKISNGTAIITGTAPSSGLAQVKFGKSVVWLADKTWVAPRIWAPRVGSGTSGNGRYELGPRTDAVLVLGPYLVRNATITGSTVAIVGDLKSASTTDIEVLAPASIKSVSWNGKSVKVSKTATGTLKGFVAVKDLTPKLPNLKTLEWKCTDSLPEVAVGFDDSKWTTATKTKTQRPAEFQPFGGKVVLYADEYGYHQGNLLYRGSFDGNATGVRLSVQGGFNFGFSAFLNGVFLGSGQGTSENDPTGGKDLVNATYAFPAGVVIPGKPNVVTVVIDHMGLDEDWHSRDEFKAPRGIRGYELQGGVDFTSWKLTGNVEAEDTTDIIRGPLNTGGLYVERIGAIYPNYRSTGAWNSSKADVNCTPFAGIAKAGIKAYKTKFTLNADKATDVPIAFKFERTPSSNYRVMLYVNGWQFGRFTSNFGPQTLYPIPEGILNHRGENDVLMTLWSLDAGGAKVANVELTPTTVLSSSKEVVVGLAA